MELGRGEEILRYTRARDESVQNARTSLLQNGVTKFRVLVPNFPSSWSEACQALREYFPDLFDRLALRSPMQGGITLEKLCREHPNGQILPNLRSKWYDIDILLNLEPDYTSENFFLYFSKPDNLEDPYGSGQTEIGREAFKFINHLLTSVPAGEFNQKANDYIEFIKHRIKDYENRWRHNLNDIQ